MTVAATAALTTADGRPLKVALASAQLRAKRRAFLLVLPLLLFVFLTFLVPIGVMLNRSFEHDGFSKSAPALVAYFAATRDFDAKNPPEAAYAALLDDLARMQVEKKTGLAGARINYNVPGTISQFKSGARAAKDLAPPTKRRCWRWIPTGACLRCGWPWPPRQPRQRQIFTKWQPTAS